MSFILKKRLRTVSSRIRRLQSELNVLDHQLVQLEEEAEDARLRSLVSEGPAEAVAYDQARRQRDILDREGERQRRELEALLADQDALLDRLAQKAQPADG